MNITVPEIIIKTVTDEDGAEIEKKPEFFVCDFQMNGRVAASAGVEITF